MDALQFDLRGSSLIEASAGTGKTFTIAALYLRLVLGHGGAQAFARPLTPPEILVVTFTEAATKELRERIRTRLAEAARAFAEAPGGDATAAQAIDPLLARLRESYAPAEWPACAERLRIAADWMDEAAVSTIHGWCNRMLREHAFDSGSLFSQTLEADQTELVDEAVRDYWRTFFYPLGADAALAVAGWWPEPGALRGEVWRLLPHVDALVAPGDGPRAPADALAEAATHRAARLAELRQPWPAWCDGLQRLLDEASGRKLFDGRKLQPGRYTGWIDQLRQWGQGEREHPGLTDAALSRLSHAGLREVWKVPGDAPDHPALASLAALPAELASLPDGRDELLAHAAWWVADRLRREKHRRAEMGFDDLLVQLDDALRAPESGARLAALVRRQFPVALIDEFQDTDPVQYDIFRRIYHRPTGQPADQPADRSVEESAAPPTAMVLIGDPKQAIYAFRGADIYTYLAARRDTTGHHATLDTNFRSTAAMVDAVNRVFGQAEARPEGAGAFLFRTPHDNPVPFVPVGAKGRDEAWWVDDGGAGENARPAALTLWAHEPADNISDADYRRAMAAGCAAEVVRLLDLGQRGRAGFVDDAALRPVQASDIAILVNGRTEAQAVREALGALNVRSVYLSDAENVFRTPAAGELQRLLQACAAPDDGRLLRAALGTALLGLDWPALDRLNHDELHWDERLAQFRGYHERWQRQGVLPMMRRLLQDFGVPERLIAARDERQLTDLLHLTELLQQASALVDGEHALVRHLAEQRQAAGNAADQRQQRLESDADLLKVVTVHKSKGLEYPLVFVPFACTAWPVTAESLPLKWHGDDGAPRVSLTPTDADLRAADRERLGEDLRKLYVALTRARFATWLGVATTQNLPRSAVGYLLAGAQPVAAGQLQATLRASLGPDDGTVAIVPPPPAATAPFVPASSVRPALAPPLVAHVPRDRWWIASYSRLRVMDAGPDEARVPPETAEEENFLEAAGDAPSTAADQSAASGTLHAFPSGAADGTFLHGLLEWAGRQGFAQAAAAPDALREQIARRAQPARWAPHQAALFDWLGGWLQAPLDLGRLTPGAAPVAPADLRSVQIEMEFWLGMQTMDAQALDAAVRRHTLRGVARAPLAPQTLAGMLKGFIDLVFEHEGRYYVADYKSNRLGDDDSAYTAAAMREQVLHHRYELQYSLYLFALHRLLRARLPDYDYDTHVGGAVYIFLRGHAAPGQGLHLEKPPRALMDELDALFGLGVTA